MQIKTTMNYHLTSEMITEMRMAIIKNIREGFPGGAVVGSLPANAGDAGSSLGLGRSHMPQSGWAREPQLLSLRVWSCAPQQEGPRW